MRRLDSGPIAAGPALFGLCTWIVLAHMAGPTAAETLADAWQLALQRDRQLAALGERSAGARAEEAAARGARWPQLSVEGGYQRFDDAPNFRFGLAGQDFVVPLVDDDEYWSARARLALPLYTAGRVGNAVESASLAAAAAGLSEAGYAQGLKLEVARAYLDVLRAERALAAAESTVASLAAHVADVSSLYERELVARNDLLAAQVSLADAEQARLRSANGLELARAAYNRWLGEPLDRLPALDPAVATVAPPAGAELAALIEQALASRPELAGLDAQAQALSARAQSQRAESWPQLGLLADYQYLENEVLDTDGFAAVGVGFSWNVFDGGQARQRANATARAGRAAAEQRDDLRSRIALEVRAAWLDLREAEARVPVAGQAVEQAEENLRVAKELYGAGLGTNTEVLDAEALRLTSVSNRDNAVLDLALAGFRLQRALGDL